MSPSPIERMIDNACMKRELDVAERDAARARAYNAKDRPIIMMDRNVRAIRHGAKTETRRIVKTKLLPPMPSYGGMNYLGEALFWPGGSDDAADAWLESHDARIRCPYGAVGTKLWVKEAWDYVGGDEMLYQQEPGAVVYRADVKPEHFSRTWRTPLFMPRWAARLTLVVTDVRCERLRAITRESAWREGIARHCEGCALAGQSSTCPGCYDAVPRFADLWREIHGAASWAENPWVWVIGFRANDAKETAK